MTPIPKIRGYRIHATVRNESAKSWRGVPRESLPNGRGSRSPPLPPRVLGVLTGRRTPKGPGGLRSAGARGRVRNFDEAPLRRSKIHAVGTGVNVNTQFFHSRPGTSLPARRRVAGGTPRGSVGGGGRHGAWGANWPIELGYSTEKEVKGRFRWNVSGMRGNSKNSTILGSN